MRCAWPRSLFTINSACIYFDRGVCNPMLWFTIKEERRATLVFCVRVLRNCLDALQATIM